MDLDDGLTDGYSSMMFHCGKLKQPHNTYILPFFREFF